MGQGQQRIAVGAPEVATVPPPLFREVEHLVGDAVQGLMIFTALGEGDAAEGNRRADRLGMVRVGEPEVGDPNLDSGHDVAGRFHGRVGQHKGELFAADPADDVDASQPLQQLASHGLEDPVPSSDDRRNR